VSLALWERACYYPDTDGAGLTFAFEPTFPLCLGEISGAVRPDNAKQTKPGEARKEAAMMLQTGQKCLDLPPPAFSQASDSPQGKTSPSKMPVLFFFFSNDGLESSAAFTPACGGAV
jgi:hypothetical protein